MVGATADRAYDKEFRQLVAALAETIIADTRARKAGAGGPAAAARDAQKNSARKPVSKNTAKPGASSPKPKRV